ncbi:phosphatase domain-containing putative toxin [Maridesulfovibrio frigidus]|uniref:phosphatase domain-containing putative toxin n=1 Tax=Maridesulfovibrio frigidus TaxID=340956 RepID=UPI0004E17498|nr:dual specificity protein phosphatase family protein [Maridesulfovibrio frigidus]
MISKPAYNLTWVTEQLAIGCAPMSFAQLESLEDQGINAILNLCGEFFDLHSIQMEAGFDVHYLPLDDEDAPGLIELEKTLEWLDEAIYIGKKVLIHCRHGIGRTGTVLNAYLLRRGLGHRLASKALSKLRAKPTNFAQWWAIRKYGRKSRKLKIREPHLEFKRLVDLAPFFSDYVRLINSIEIKAVANPGHEQCGLDHNLCCKTPIRLTLVEAVHLSHSINLELTHAERIEVIRKGVEASRLEKSAANDLISENNSREYCLSDSEAICPLLMNKYCMLYDNRPLQCRTFGVDLSDDGSLWGEFLEPALNKISSEIWFAYTGSMSGIKMPLFSLPDVVSGKFIESLFKCMMDEGLLDE